MAHSPVRRPVGRRVRWIEATWWTESTAQSVGAPRRGGSGGQPRYGRPVRGVGLLAALLLVVPLSAACTGSGAPPPPSGVEGTALSLPPRPRDLWIDAVEPCSLLTVAQRAELGLDGQPTTSRSTSALFGGPESVCLFRGYTPRAVSVGIGLVTTTGIERVSNGELQASLAVVHVQGFPAVRAVPDRFTKFCSVMVDIAPGQLLDVQYSDGGRHPAIPQDELCRGAENVASASVRTLSDR